MISDFMSIIWLHTPTSLSEPVKQTISMLYFKNHYTIMVFLHDRLSGSSLKVNAVARQAHTRFSNLLLPLFYISG